MSRFANSQYQPPATQPAVGGYARGQNPMQQPPRGAPSAPTQYGTGPPPGYGQPPQYAPPVAAARGPPAGRAPTQYGAPPTPYGPPPTQYGAPPTQYGAPPTQYGAPPNPYGAPPNPYGQPPTQYNNQYAAPPAPTPEPTPVGPNGHPLVSMEGALRILDDFLVTQRDGVNPELFARLGKVEEDLAAALQRLDAIEDKINAVSANSAPLPSLNGLN